MPAYQTDRQWRYRKVVRLPDGARKRISGTPSINTKAAAETAERAHIERLFNPVREPALTRTVEFRVFASEWLRLYPEALNKRSTVVVRTLHVREHLIPYWGAKALAELNNSALTEFLAHMRSKKSERTGRELTLQTIKGVMLTLHKILRCAIEWGKLDAMPTFPKVKVPKAKFDYLQQSEIDSLLRTIPYPEDYAAVVFALRTGARVGEQHALEWSDVDWRSHKIRIWRSVHHTSAVVGTTKGGRERWIDMAPSVEEALRKIRHLRSPRVWCAMDGGPLPYLHFYLMLRRYLEAAGLRMIRWHDLRHTFASSLVTAGVNLRQVQEWMGHTSIETTMRYAHLAKSAGAQLIAVLDRQGV